MLGKQPDEKRGNYEQKPLVLASLQFIIPLDCTRFPNILFNGHLIHMMLYSLLMSVALQLLKWYSSEGKKKKPEHQIEKEKMLQARKLMHLKPLV